MIYDVRKWFMSISVARLLLLICLSILQCKFQLKVKVVMAELQVVNVIILWFRKIGFDRALATV